ncbi:MAG: glycosyl transferase [Candidatus Tokpelaia sp. JSC188]|nr:MAG: glycosyl transferase [Candidatus Tokpelaia sp. JSC188]
MDYFLIGLETIIHCWYPFHIMRLYTINLDRSTERLRRVKVFFGKQNLKLTRISAIDSQVISDTEYATLTAKQCWVEPLTRGEVACFLSHRLALQHIAKEAESYGAIFEDDVILSKSAHFFLKDSGWIPKGVDILKIETQHKKVRLGPSITVREGFTIARLKSTHIMAAAYIVSKQAAARLAGQMNCVSIPFDHFLFNFEYGIAPFLNIYQQVPAIAMQAELTSTLENERAQNKRAKKQKRRLIQTLHREVRRIGTRNCNGLQGLIINTITNEQWKRIPFEKD